MAHLDRHDVDRYLERIGLDPDAVRDAPADRETLARLQTAHVRSIPFENLSIIGNPHEPGLGEGVSLDLDDLDAKLIERERGGYCFELNGLFTCLLEALGFEVHRAAAMVLDGDGEAATPANHHTIIASLDRTYVTDPGLGRPQMARPTPLEGDPSAPDAAGVQWRVVETDRPRYDLLMQARQPEGDWSDRYVFDTTPRDLSYFAATNDYFARAPESMWRQFLIARRKTPSGWVELSADSLTRHEDGTTTEREVSPDELEDFLAAEFGLSIPD